MSPLVEIEFIYGGVFVLGYRQGAMTFLREKEGERTLIFDKIGGRRLFVKVRIEFIPIPKHQYRISGQHP